MTLFPPSRRHAADWLLWPAAAIIVLAELLLWRSAVWLGRQVSRRLRLPRLRAWLGRLPPALALPLFLVPELASRTGAIWAAWLLIQGHFRAATLVYAGSKLAASVVAVWTYQAVEPALLQIRWFALIRIEVLRARDWARNWARDWALAALWRPGGDGRPSRFAFHRRRIAAAIVRPPAPGGSTAGPAPATPSEPTGRPPTA